MKISYLSLIIIVTIAGCGQKKLFEQLDPKFTGIHFNNAIKENDTINPLDITNMYNGGGVGIGDFNNDGLQDIYFTGNLVPNKLYLNKGDLHFNDITTAARADGEGKWCKGISVVDINNDGWLDMYVSCSILDDPHKRENILYVNQGLTAEGIPYFKNLAAEYGLNDTTQSTMAAFFDYDNDGDLDMYLVVNVIPKGENPNIFRTTVKNGNYPNTGRLYRNDWSDSLKHPVFTDVSKIAGTTIEGYGHGVTVADINKDGWEDLYVSNDFLPDNILYINNHDGTFTNKAKDYFKHTSANSMGQDIIDINNDGLQDVIELDMRPEDNYRKKTMMNGNNYRVYQNIDAFGYQYQYARNVLQLNEGPRITSNDSTGDPIFSDIGFYAGIAETDWSWTPLVADFDNDGYRDLIITNGYPKDVTDHDFIAFRNKSYQFISKKELLEQIPEVKIPNYAYHNNGDLTFSDVTNGWGLNKPSYSNGAAYADLDNDGDMDVIINNINDSAFIYRNTYRDNAGKNINRHYLSVKLVGDSFNRNGFGCWMEVFYQGKKQVYEQTPYRGYLSTIQFDAHFGLGEANTVDSLIVSWPGGIKQVMLQLPADQKIVANKKDANQPYSWNREPLVKNTLVMGITDSVGIHYRQQENDFIDFDYQKLLPHKLSEYGPALAAGDVDGNGLDDIIVGGSASYSTTLLLQQAGGKFIERPMRSNVDKHPKTTEDMGIVLLDADGDGDLDMYVASGGYEAVRDASSYQDKLYTNNGHGEFAIDSLSLPGNHTSKSCVRVADYDNDGDLDLFIAGRVEPWNYPKPVSSFIYRNDTKNGVIKFTDVTDSIAPSLHNIGLICDASWTDFNNDGFQDLVLAGEWMPVIFLKNNNGKFENITDNSGISGNRGFWNSIAPGDFDNDGDMDYIVGNLGENTFYQCSEQYPVSIYAKDFDNNGVLECIPTKFIKDRQGALQEYTIHTRDDVVDQMPFIKKNFLTYKAFSEARFDQLLTPEQRNDMLVLHANYSKSIYLENKGQGKFEMHALPTAAQLAPLNGMVSLDINDDGNLDIIICGNDFGTEVGSGRYDACNGLILLGDGKGKFTSLTIAQSGFYVPGNAKALVMLRNAKGELLLAASQNRDALKLFAIKKSLKTIPLSANEVAANILFRNEKTQRAEANYGCSFLSQSSRFLCVPPGAKSITIINSSGKKRLLNY